MEFWKDGRIRLILAYAMSFALHYLWLLLNIHDVLEKTKDLAKASFASHIRFYEDYDPSLPNISGHFDSLVQVFLNLFKNSSEAAPKTGGTIKICTSYRSGIKILTMNKQIKNYL